MSIVAAESVSCFFHEAVEGAMKARRVDATDGATTYIVSLLSDFTRPDSRAEETLDRPLAFLLDEALHTAPLAERFEKLRVLGDGVLYGCGFFGDHFEARGVDQRYLVGIGATAYSSARSIVRGNTGGSDLYGELAEKFAAFVDVIAEIANATTARAVAGSAGLVKLYERWLRTRSESIAQALTTHGFMPHAGGKG